MASGLPFIVIGPRGFPGKAAAIPVLSLMLLILVAAIGCIREDDLTLEQRSHQLAAQLMCPVCDGQTIDGSNAQIAQDMRVKVRELLDSGSTNAQIKDYFVVRYGEEILAAPSGRGFNLIAWIVPFFIVSGGIAIALVTIRNLKRSNARSSGVASAGGGTDLAEYLARVDQDLGISDAPTISEADPKSTKTKNSGPENKATS
ncbi:MAG: cytochrome c-type biogenesis protein CcmH [Chloroflexi bacterium]|nr:cytochrome c-type biogenesis protein CcmH [Chloroflexota bacterium]